MKKETMNKQEFVNEVVEGLKAQDIKLSKEAMKKVVAEMEAVIDSAVKAGKQVNVFGVQHSSREVAAKTGIIQLGSRKGEQWTTPARIVPTVKLLDSKKKELTINK